MDTKTKLQEALKDALRTGNQMRKDTLRMTIAAIKLAEVQPGGKSLDEAAYLAIVQKEVKSRRESIADAERAQRPDLIAAAEAEIIILEEFLPKSISPAELEELARQVIAETGATSIREMGQVMKTLIPRLQGRATGDQASQAVRKLLQ
ncbi:MAG TPA: GatB/YqeY domain-containing protein [Anaerolineales bacterium]|nr:GatB/YqeY domain-containing protein [Anaerolineales bacterium]